MKPFWKRTEGDGLAQGDLLLGCHVPAFGEDFGTEGVETEIAVKETDLIVVTQSCDLENDKVALVALCPVHKLDAFEQTNPAFRIRNRWEMVRKGQQPGLHLLASPETPEDNRTALVVDFGEIHSLPPSYVKKRAAQLGARWRLESPFLEHFSQAIARYFMRVGLPSSIPPFKERARPVADKLGRLWWRETGRTHSCSPQVSMVEATDASKRDDGPVARRIDSTRDGCVTV